MTTPFSNWNKFITRPRVRPDGTPICFPDGEPIFERLEVPRWESEKTVRFLKTSGSALSASACRDGWHVQLVGFVQCQHRLPNESECEALVLDHQKIEQATKHSPKRQDILRVREKLKEALLQPLQLQAAE